MSSGEDLVISKGEVTLLEPKPSDDIEVHEGITSGENEGQIEDHEGIASGEE